MYFKIKIWILGKETNALFRLWNKSHCFEEPGIQVAPGGHLGWCDQRALYSNILLLYLLFELYNCLLTPSQYCGRKAQSQGNGALPIIPMGFWYTLHFSKIPLYPSQTFLSPPPPQPLAFEMIATAMVSSTKLTHRPLSTCVVVTTTLARYTDETLDKGGPRRRWWGSLASVAFA